MTSEATELLMPKLGLTMTEGTVAECCVQPGQAFRAGDVVAIIETEKITNDLEAPADGELTEWLVSVGSAVDVGAPIARWRALATRPLPPLGEAPLAMPVAAASPLATHRHRAATAFEVGLARRMVAAKAEVPHFYLVTECNAGPVVDALARRVTAPRITLTSCLLWAIAAAVSEDSQFNRVWRDGQIVEFESIDIGVAVNAPDGLMVPILRDVSSLSLPAIAERLSSIAARARSGNLTLDDTAGGALTVSNAGMHDVTAMYPIITPGHSATLGVGSVRSVFRPDTDGRPALRRELTLVLSMDHRLYDGVSGLRLLNAVRNRFEALDSAEIVGGAA